jgi:phosphohistidine phosphatase
MQLYILRHADADTVAENDDDRHLSQKGVLQSQRMARFCEAHEIKPALILTSPIRRAHQTAKIVADHLRVDLRIVRAFACGALPAAFVAELREHRSLPSAMIVGHEPDLSHFAAHLIDTPKHECLHIRKASLLHFTLFDFESGGARLEFLIPSKLV